jgi:hypothetical protein
VVVVVVVVEVVVVGGTQTWMPWCRHWARTWALHFARFLPPWAATQALISSLQCWLHCFRRLAPLEATRASSSAMVTAGRM